MADRSGTQADWIEIYNAKDTPIDLAGWILADATTTWTVPSNLQGNATLVDPGEYKIVWASGKGDGGHPEFPGPSGEIHTDFKLSSSGQLVRLIDPTGCEVSRLDVPALGKNESFGRDQQYNTGKNLIFPVGLATPRRQNGPDYYLEEPVCYSPNDSIKLHTLVAKNADLQTDGDGDYSDYVEITNTGYNEVSLGVWQLSDNGATWVLPGDLSIKPKETIRIWLSGKGDNLDAKYPGPANELHASFKLSSGGETITLAEPSGCIVTSVTTPDMKKNEGYVLQPDGTYRVELLSAPAQSCPAVNARITTVVAKNKTRLDEDGDAGDWLELTNFGSEPLDLSNWVISDTGANWTIPTGLKIAPGELQLIWLDEKDRSKVSNQAGASQLHTNFKLSSDGETVTLVTDGGCLIQSITYPPLEKDQGYVYGQNGQYSVVQLASSKTSKDEDKKDEKADAGSKTAGAKATGTCLVINELQAKNDSTIEDSFGEFGDWIELANLGEKNYDLSGHSISDEEDAWAFPDGTVIKPGEVLLVWADETDMVTDDGELHTSFKLGKSGEPITVTDGDGNVVAFLETYPKLDDDESFGVDDSGTKYVIHDAGDATPGKGPIFNTGCGLELGIGGGSDSDLVDSAGDSTTSDSTEDKEQLKPDSLARTGTNSLWMSFAGELLIFAGVALASFAAVSTRRASK